MERPRQIVVLSGKGGTGKTTVTACLARLAGPVVAADADVDAANLALLLPGVDGPAEPFEAGRRAVIDAERCLWCGVCRDACRFDAIELPVRGPARVRTERCEGCGACDVVCPVQAVTFRPNVAGAWRVRQLAAPPGGAPPRTVGWLVHAALGIAQDNSGKLVARVREEARRLAVAHGVPLVVVDGPPGIGCPVHAALTGADVLLAVTEPTPAGEHDVLRLLRLAAHFGVPARVAINKWDLAPAVADRLARRCEEAGAPVIGRIPFDPGVPRALARGRLPLDAPVLPATRAALFGIAAQLDVPAGAAPDSAAAVPGATR
jgi:MinD superfamily P-loop ATPase